MKKTLLSAVILLLSVFCAAGQTPEGALIDAVTLYSTGRNKEALSLLELLSKATPKDDAVWYYLSQAQSQAGQDEEALASLEKAVALDGNNFWYRRPLARMYLMKGRTEEGIAIYEGLLKDFPGNNEVVYELLDIYLGSNQFEKALATIDEIEHTQGPSEELVTTRYDVYAAMGRADEGAEALERFSEQYSLPSVLSMLGNHYLAEFSDSLAQARFTEALSLDSSYIPAVLGLSEVYRHQRRYEDYFATLEPVFTSEDVPVSTKSRYIGNLPRSMDPKILQLHREGFDHMVTEAGKCHAEDTVMLSAVGGYFYATGRAAEAGPWFRAAADLYPESIGQTATYVHYLSLQEDWKALQERAVAAFNRFRELAFLEYANMANYQLEDYDAIIGNCQYILSNFKDDKSLMLSALSVQGDAYHAKGQEKEAFRAYDKALKLNPDYAPVLNNYAYYLSLKGKSLKKAYNMSKKTVEAEPDNATYLDTFAWILHLMGKDLEAKPFFKHAMLYGGKESAVILRHYATVLDALGETESAKLYRSQAARLDEKEKRQ